MPEVRQVRLRKYLGPRHDDITIDSLIHDVRSLLLYQLRVHIHSLKKRPDEKFGKKYTATMPAIRHASKRKAPPAGFSDIEDSLLIFANKMKDAENLPSTNIPRHKVHWPIFQISHQRSRYVWELYQQEKISKELYEWLCKNGYADAMLIAKWKKDSYAKVSWVHEG